MMDWSVLKKRAAEYNGDRIVNFTIAGVALDNGNILPYGQEKNACGQYIVANKIIKEIELQGERFAVRSSRTSVYGTPSFTLKCCSAQEAADDFSKDNQGEGNEVRNARRKRHANCKSTLTLTYLDLERLKQHCAQGIVAFLGVEHLMVG